MTAKLPYIPLFVDDILAETQHLEPHEFGAYIALLTCLWRAGGKLPDDDRTLSRMTRMTLAGWRKIRAEVLSLFTLNTDGTISNKRISAELRLAAARSEAAKANANTRWNQEKKSRKFNEGDDADAILSRYHCPTERDPGAMLPIPKELCPDNSVERWGWMEEGVHIAAGNRGDQSYWPDGCKKPSRFNA